MTEKKELNNDELEKVTGGTIDGSFGEEDIELQQYMAMCPKKISFDEVPSYVGKNALIYESWSTGKHGHCLHYSYYYGTIVETFLESAGCGSFRKVKMNYIAMGGEANPNQKLNGLTDMSTVFVGG